MNNPRRWMEQMGQGFATQVGGKKATVLMQEQEQPFVLGWCSFTRARTAGRVQGPPMLPRPEVPASYSAGDPCGSRSICGSAAGAGGTSPVPTLTY